MIPGSIITVKYFKQKKYAECAVSLYFSLTFLVIGYIVGVLNFKESDVFKILLREGPLSTLSGTIFYVAVSWLYLGILLILIYKKKITPDNILFVIGFSLFSFIYLNFLREKITYGDEMDYVNAAINMYNGKPLPPRYLYPPFWASFLQVLVPWGKDTMIFIIRSLNFFSMLLFYFLLYRFLIRFKFSKKTASLIIFVFLLVNVPVLRNMSYSQTNIHVMNLVLLSLLMFRKSHFLSALMLVVAVHLKFTPIILVIPFILKKNWKWMINFILLFILIVIATSLLNNFDYYANSVSNITHVFDSRFIIFGKGGISFRNVSIDNIIHSLFLFLSIKISVLPFVVYPLKLFIILFTLGIMFRVSKNQTFYRSEDPDEESIFNSFIVLLFLMLVLSPIIWVYHFVFIIPSCLIIIKNLSSIKEYLMYLSAYFLIYAIPTFDFFPFSFHRVAGIVLFYMLLSRSYKNMKDAEPYFSNLNNLKFTKIRDDLLSKQR